MDDLLTRYDRQLMIDGFGEEGQRKLKQASVFVAGAGGLGSPAAIYLTAAGVGHIRIVDHDKIDITNLNRQILHWDKDVGRNKIDSAKEKLGSMNPDVRVEAIAETISENNVSKLIADCDLIVDALDNFPTRYLLNKAALEKNIPFCHGAVYGFEGRAMTTLPGKSACFRCLYKQGAPSTLPKFPVIGVTPAIIGCIQATEAIKYLIGIGDLLTNRLLVYDGLSMLFSKMELKKDPDCVDCGHINPNIA